MRLQAKIGSQGRAAQEKATKKHQNKNKTEKKSKSLIIYQLTSPMQWGLISSEKEKS